MVVRKSDSGPLPARVRSWEPRRRLRAKGGQKRSKVATVSSGERVFSFRVWAVHTEMACKHA